MRIAPRVYTAQVDIDRLQARIFELPNDQHVELTLDDGRVLRGIVAARPMTMQFFDADGREGTNGTVRLEQPALERPEQASMGRIQFGRDECALSDAPGARRGSISWRSR